MLKKLVKYGNSNALVLDKAILELLGIEEGSTLKIKTDGVSIILTPHDKVTTEKVHVPFTHEQANLEASVKESFKRYKGIGKDKQDKLERKLLDLLEMNKDLHIKLLQSPDYVKEVTQLNKQVDPLSPEYAETFKAIRNRFSPELMQVENELMNFESNNKLSIDEQSALNLKEKRNLNEEQRKALQQEYRAIFNKNQAIYKAYAELSNNPEYQHEAQLIAEKYNNDKNSADYLRAMDELTHKYLPEFRQLREEINAVAVRYGDRK